MFKIYNVQQTKHPLDYLATSMCATKHAYSARLGWKYANYLSAFNPHIAFLVIRITKRR